ncbi:MAG: cysteine protease [Theionarchaea archaeon]|nr:MAG: cysteine protease [Theionarchaea archaeon DG-70-1]MBU7026039.1 cysteine protease [Theionarchaea archaeon]
MSVMYIEIELPETGEIVGTGWLPPLPDMRDYTVEHPNIAPMTEKLGILKAERALKTKVDLRKWCSPIENQGRLGSCTAHAAVGIVEYFQNRAFGEYINGSRLFVYKATRNLMKVVGDTGAYIRTTMGALDLCGVAPECYWPYTDKKPNFDKEPSAFIYKLAGEFEAIKYFCYDPRGANIPGDKVLGEVKKQLAAGVPSMFGFYIFSSFKDTDVKGGIPYPCSGEKAGGGHAMVAVGYDDKLKIKNLKCNEETTGALLIRNSWGTAWGDKGYGWLPYEYVRKRLAWDFWSLLNMTWVDTGQFGFLGEG